MLEALATLEKEMVAVRKSGLQIKVRNWNLFFLFLTQNICGWYSKEPSHWDGSFKHPNHVFYFTGKKLITILRSTILLNWAYGK